MAAGFIHDDPVRRIASVNPDHGHRLEGQVDEVMAPALGNKCGRIAGELMTLALNDGGRATLDDRDRLIELMAVAGQTGTGFKQTIAAANTPRAHISTKEVLEPSKRGKIKPRRGVVATDSLGTGAARRAGRLFVRRESAVDPGLFRRGARE